MIDFHRRIYGALVRLHPAAFRNQFGREMALDFDDALAAYGFGRLFLDSARSLVRQWTAHILSTAPDPISAPRPSLLAGDYVMIRDAAFTPLELVRGLLASATLLALCLFGLNADSGRKPALSVVYAASTASEQNATKGSAAPSSAAPEGKDLSNDKTSFEVASIRRTKPGSGGYALSQFTRDGFRARNNTVKMILLLHAYETNDPSMTVAESSIPAAPQWVQTDPYDIQAKMSDADVAALSKLSPQQQLSEKRLMLQALFADRFKLRLHFVPRQAPCYALIRAKKGPKNMKEAAEDEKTKVSWSDLNHVRYHSMPIVGFVALLSGIEGCPVDDKTGLTGRYDFALEFARDSARAQTPDGDVAPPVDASLPNLHAAIQQQLGLKLQPEKVLIQSMVIDHIERPSPN